MIIIIGILAAIAIPMFLGQREKAKDAGCQGGHALDRSVGIAELRPSDNNDDLSRPRRSDRDRRSSTDVGRLGPTSTIVADEPVGTSARGMAIDCGTSRATTPTIATGRPGDRVVTRRRAHEPARAIFVVVQ